MFGIKKAAEMTGIPEVTLRQWERRYQVIQPTRSESGARHYTQKNIEDILWLKKQRDDYGISIKQAMDMLHEKKEVRIVKTTTENSYDGYIKRIYEALVDFKIDSATKYINLCFSMFDFEEVFHEIFTPILHRVGSDWETGQLSVGQEHFISNFLERRLFPFFQDLTSDSAKAKAMALCAPGELHNIGLLIFSLFLKRRGMEVIFLGQNTPTDCLPPLISQNQVKLICISATMSENVAKVEDFVRDLRTEDADLDFVIGGAAANSLSDSFQSYVLKGGIVEWENWLKGKH